MKNIDKFNKCFTKSLFFKVLLNYKIFKMNVLEKILNLSFQNKLHERSE